MAISRVSFASASPAASGAFTLVLAAHAGNTIIVCVFGGASSVTDSLGNQFIMLRNGLSTPNGNAQMWGTPPGSGVATGSDTITIIAGTYASAVAIEYSGVAAYGASNSSGNTSAGTSATMSAGGITTSANGSWVVTCAWLEYFTGFTLTNVDGTQVDTAGNSANASAGAANDNSAANAGSSLDAYSEYTIVGGTQSQWSACQIELRAIPPNPQVLKTAQAQGGNDAAGPVSVTVSVPKGATILAFVGWNANASGTGMGVTDSAGSLTTVGISDAATHPSCGAWVEDGASAGSHTITANGAATDLSIMLTVVVLGFVSTPPTNDFSDFPAAGSGQEATWNVPGLGVPSTDLFFGCAVIAHEDLNEPEIIVTRFDSYLVQQIGWVVSGSSYYQMTLTVAWILVSDTGTATIEDTSQITTPRIADGYLTIKPGTSGPPTTVSGQWFWWDRGSPQVPLV